jgi:hypothetical protein
MTCRTRMQGSVTAAELEVIVGCLKEEGSLYSAMTEAQERGYISQKYYIAVSTRKVRLKPTYSTPASETLSKMMLVEMLLESLFLYLEATAVHDYVREE